ncbi:MBL fold metallo-hydrolase [Yinghuangia seranimata]|uniref:MBL fold metallo-hydrolase n=1 Tax=Yinghuangia seranimata TaxID=408067 RepID=UPI00248C4743|nr:MBL fold metallo-hydrolase [Yinghuangia seranimata]MDI2126570.1 MBL fold metallo-hydrolase [Yinghuangia seranimata]
MRTLTVLGTCGAWPEAGRSASGFLLEYDGFRVVLDLGYATVPRLLEHRPGGDVDAVVVTHEHPDHCADLSALTRARYFADVRGPRIPLYCTPGVFSRVQAMEPTEDLNEVFDVHELPASYEVGPFRLDSALLPHYVPHAGVRLSAPGLTVMYSADAGPAPELAELAAGADLFIAGVTLQGTVEEHDEPYLLTTVDAGQWATRAGAKRLMLTHFWPGSDRKRWADDARTGFDGEVVIAEEGMVLTL